VKKPLDLRTCPQAPLPGVSVTNVQTGPGWKDFPEQRTVEEMAY
jgi:hypothetical protein